MNNLSICYVANHAINYSHEGHNIASIRIIKAANEAELDTKIVTFEDKICAPMKNYFPIYTPSTSKRRTSIFPPIQETAYSIPAMLQTKNLDCEIIHLLNVTKETFLILKKILQIKKPCIAHLYHSSLPFSTYSNFKLRLSLMKIGLYEHIFCSNKSLKNYLIMKNICKTENIHHVPFPIDVKHFKPRNRQKMREKHGFFKEAPIILYVGQIDPYRGFLTILKAFKEISKNIPEAVFYVCHPNLKQEEQKLSTFLSLARKMIANLVISGPNPFIEEIYSLADIVVLPFQKPYWVTAPPLVLVEAMASATPIVTTPLDVIGDIGKNYENMLFSIPDNANSLVESIFYILNNEEEAKKIGINARKYVIQNFSMEKVGMRLREAYKNIYN